MRRFYLYSMAHFGLFAFVSCASVRKDDHSYTYVYQQLTQPQPSSQVPVREYPASPPVPESLALEADPEPAPSGGPGRTYFGAQERVYGAAPVREYSPVQNVAYTPAGPVYAPPQSVYYRAPAESCARPVYRVPAIVPVSFGLFFGSGIHGGSGGNCRRPVKTGGGGGCYSGPVVCPSVRGSHGKGR